MFFRTLAITAALSGLVSAIDISPGCQRTIVSILVSPDVQCLNPEGLVTIGFLDPNDSVIGSIDAWLKGLCDLDPCTDSSLVAIATSLASGCETEFANIGITPDDLSHLHHVYPVGRKAVCLEDTSTNTLCVTETLTALQDFAGTISLNNGDNVIANLSSGNPLPMEVLCTNCVKATYNLYMRELPGSLDSQTEPLQMQCGADFVDGQDPSGISETASGD